MQLIKALAAKCHALVLSDQVGISDDSSITGDAFLSTFKELSKWEDVETSDTNWELVVYKHHLAKRYTFNLDDSPKSSCLHFIFHVFFFASE